jgi:hypothetical protein
MFQFAGWDAFAKKIAGVFETKTKFEQPKQYLLSYTELHKNH